MKHPQQSENTPDGVAGGVLIREVSDKPAIELIMAGFDRGKVMQIHCVYDLAAVDRLLKELNGYRARLANRIVINQHYGND